MNWLGKNWFKLLILILVGLVSTSLMLKLRNKDAPTPTQPNFEMQEKCSTKAEKVFQSHEDKTEISTYSNHFNKKEGKCYVVITSYAVGGGGLGKKLFIDSYQNSVEAMCRFGYETQELNSCNISNEVVSKEDFDEFIKSYMEN